MKIRITVGNQEKHEVEFSWNQFFGIAKIFVDGAIIFKSKPLCVSEIGQLAGYLDKGILRVAQQARDIRNLNLFREWHINVGVAEKHKVFFVKERPILLAGLRRHKFYVLVDGQLVKKT